jgi:hypothetical protein
MIYDLKDQTDQAKKAAGLDDECETEILKIASFG